MTNDYLNTTECEVDDDLYNIWTKKFPVSELGEVDLFITKKRLMKTTKRK